MTWNSKDISKSLDIFNIMKNYCLILFFSCFNLSFSQQIVDFSPTRVIGGKGDTLIIRGTGFGNSQGSSFVSFYQETNNYSDAKFGGSIKYVSWNNSEIKLEMPNAFSNKIKIINNNSEIISKDTLHVMANIAYRQLNPLISDLLINNFNDTGITWYIHPNYWKNPEIKQAIIDVVREFRCKTNVNYRVKELKKWMPLSTQYGIHMIGPDSNLNVVGFNEKNWSSCIVGSETFYYNKTQLIRISSKENWHYGTGQPQPGQSKFRYVLMHEMAHSLGLGHVNELGQTMYPSVTLLPSDNWCSRDSITSDEQTTMKWYVKKSQDFKFRGCGIMPLPVVKNCNEVESMLTSNDELVSSKIGLIYPNPCYSNQLFCKLPLNNNSEYKIELFNHLGQYFQPKIELNENRISLPDNLPNGTYTIVYRTSNTKIHQIIHVLFN
jgi:hypothetical protein